MIQVPDSERAGKAIGWLMFGVTSGLMLDLFAKELLRTYSLRQFILLRTLIAVAILLSIAPRFGGLQSLKSEKKRWHFFRTILAIGTMFGFFYGLANMPLVNAFTLGYTAPLMTTALAAVFLNETVGWRRWAGVSAGFVGVLVMLRPGRGEFSLAAVAVLVAAFCYACQAITARRLSDTESTLSLSFYVLFGPLFVAAVSLDRSSWLDPDALGWMLLFGAGFSSVMTWIGLVKGYRAASPALLAPFEYTALVGGAIAAYLIWDEVPGSRDTVGALIIVASGLFVVYRNREAGSRAPRPGV